MLTGFCSGGVRKIEEREERKGREGKGRESEGM